MWELGRGPSPKTGAPNVTSFKFPGLYHFIILFSLLLLNVISRKLTEIFTALNSIGNQYQISS